MTIRESRGVFTLTEPVEPDWQELPLPDALQVVDLEVDQDGTLWALALRGPRGWRDLFAKFRQRDQPVDSRLEDSRTSVPAFGNVAGRQPDPNTYVLRLKPDDSWATEARVGGGLSLATLHDGSVAVGGAHRLVMRTPQGAWSAIDAPGRLWRVWGSDATCVYALRLWPEEDGTDAEAADTWSPLLYFDGASWAAIDLEAHDIRGFFCDGACDQRGEGWIIGTYGTHSCMAHGKAAEWRPDGCGSWYLYHVHVSPDGMAYALGGDGLWRHEGKRWIAVEAFGRDIGNPLALGSVNGQPWAIDSRNLIEWVEGHRAALGLFAGVVWVTLLPPRRWMRSRDRPAFAIARTGDVYLGSSDGVWHAPSIEDEVGMRWPPRRMTPREDPQLAASEPLVRAWHELDGSRRLVRYQWFHDTLVGVVDRYLGSTLVRWRDLAGPAEQICELPYHVEALAIAPSGREAAVIPVRKEEGGVIVGSRRLLLIDLETGERRDKALPKGVSCSISGARLHWSADGSCLALECESPGPGQGREAIFLYRAADLALLKTHRLPADTALARWDAHGLVLYFDAMLPGTFSRCDAMWLDPTSGEFRSGAECLDVSRSGRYRVSLADDALEITALTDGTTRSFLPTPDGVLCAEGSAPEHALERGAWVGDRLQFPGTLLGPVHLDLTTLTLRYALPVRREGDREAQWSPDGRFALQRPGSWDTHVQTPTLWSWGEVEP